MNERIRELALQAAGKGFTTFATSDFDSQEKIQKFAELIVRECAGVGYDASYYECALNVSNKILEHFGIEK